MRIEQKDLYRLIVIATLLTSAFFIGMFIWQRWVDQSTRISREQAIEFAIQACNPGYGLQLVEKPTVYETKTTTYEEALGFAPIPIKSKRLVWIVTLKKGRWLLVGGPAADPNNPEPLYVNECTQIIDAQTGEGLSYPIE
jgi:hypothetical protein